MSVNLHETLNPNALDYLQPFYSFYFGGRQRIHLIFYLLLFHVRLVYLLSLEVNLFVVSSVMDLKILS